MLINEEQQVIFSIVFLVLYRFKMNKKHSGGKKKKSLFKTATKIKETYKAAHLFL